MVVKDIRKDNTWWPGTVAERSAPKSYIIVLSDGRVWKRHVDHIRRGGHQDTDSLEKPEGEAKFPEPAVPVVVSPQRVHVEEHVQVPTEGNPQLPLSSAQSQAAPPPAEIKAAIQKQPEVRRSGRIRTQPSRLIETM